MLIDTPLLVFGPGPGALVVAKVASAFGFTSLVAGHETVGAEVPVPLGEDAVAALAAHGLLDVFRPYFVADNPPTITAAAFEEVLKHHCVVDMAVTVYDGMSLVERSVNGSGMAGVLSDGRSRWEVHADHFVDASALPLDLNAAIVAGAQHATAMAAKAAKA